MSNATPPYVLTFLLRHTLPRIERERVIGDLSEEYRLYIRPLQSRFRAWIWYWKEGLSLLMAYTISRLRRNGRREVSIVLDARRFRRINKRLDHDDDRKGNIMEALIQDIRFALRSLRRDPKFLLAAGLTLAIGIGANTAIFSVLNGVVLKPLPYEEPGQLVKLDWNPVGEDGTHHFMTGMDFIDLRERSESFASISAYYDYREWGMDLTAGDGARRVIIMPISSDYCRTLGVDPVIGQHLSHDDETAENRNILISHRLWQEEFAGDPGALGSSLRLDNEDFMVTGILPADFREPFDRDVDVWLPLFLQPGAPPEGSRFSQNSRDNYYLSLIGRLRPGVTLDTAQSELNSLVAGIDEVNPDRDPWRTTVIPLDAAVVGRSSSMLYLLLAAVALVLLIACVNVANLSLVRGTSRERELAIRSALGSGRARLIRQLLTESVIISVIGGLAGLFLAWGGVRFLLMIRPDAIPRVDSISFDLPIFLYAMGISLITGVFFGVISAFRSTRLDIERSLQETGRSSSAGARHRQLRGILVISQVGLAIILLVGAALLLQTFYRLNRLDLGFDPEQTVTFELNLPAATYPVVEPARRLEFSREFLRRLESIPGVQHAGAVSRLPVTGQYHSWGYVIRHESEAAGETIWHLANIRIATEGYFETLGIDLLAGREFSSADLFDAPPVAMVNQAMVDRHFQGVDPIGQQIFEGGWREIVGVVEDVRIGYRDEIPDRIYMPYEQWVRDRPWVMSHVITGDGPVEGLIEAIRRELADIDQNLVIFNFTTMDRIVGQAIARERFAMVLMLAFACSAFILALVGIYGVLSYSVSQRYREIGIRIALGAGSGKIRSSIIREGMILTTIGIIIGLGAAFFLTTLMSSLVYEIEVTDPVTFLMVAVTLSIVSWVTCFIPARRAARTDPMEIMRTE
ncbi:ABC transporter permease [Gemmatimonadota bacterium]